MLEAPKPKDQEERIAALKNLKVLDTPINPVFERITRITKQMFNVPIVAISIIDSERQWFKSTQGLNVCENDLKTSFCSHTILSDDLFMVEDAKKDDRFADNPCVTEDPHVRFYAGCPIQTDDGYKVGTLCIIDHQPRQFSAEELQTLRDMAALAQEELQKYREKYSQVKIIEELSQAKRASLIDSLTGVWNRAGTQINLQEHLKDAYEQKFKLLIAILDIDDFKKINDTYGHNAGDEVIRHVAKEAVLGLLDHDIVGRWGGEEFVIIIKFSDDQDHVLQRLEKMRATIAHDPVMFETTPIKTSITIGATIYDGTQSTSVDQVIARADSAMYDGKKGGKNQLVLN